MTDISVPQEHSSVVGGSNAAQRINCPASLAYEKLVPKSPGSSYAREGTALHELMATILNEGTPTDEVVETYIPFTYNAPAKGDEPAYSLMVDEELWFRLGEPAMEMFDEFVEQIEAETGAMFEFEVEVSGEFPGIDGAKGTSDIVWWCGKLAGVWDWKFGQGEVSPGAATPDADWGNEQTAFYMHTAIRRRPKLADAEEFVFTICQPATGSTPKTFRIDPEPLDRFRQKLIASIAEGQKLGKAARCEKGAWCKFRACKAVCPHHLGAVAEIGNLLAGRQQAQETGTPFDLQDFVAKAMSVKDEVEAWAASIAGLATQMLESGQWDGAGEWYLKDKRAGASKWAQGDKETIDILVGLGLDEAEIAPPSPLTYAKARDMIARKVKKGELPDETKIPDEAVAFGTSSGKTLTRSKEGYAAGPSATTQLAEALKNAVTKGV